MLLHMCTWSEVESYLKKSPGILIPIGSTEQHGPNGLIGTDAICPEFIGKKVGEEMDILVGPTISVGMAQHHLGFAGSVTLKPTTLIAVIRDQVISLARHGFTRFFFVNGHGGNIATVTAAFSEIYAERSMEKMSNQPSIKCALRNWWDSDGIRKLQKELFPVGEGSHATASEVALTWYKYPETMNRAELTPKVAPNGSFADAEDYRRNFPDGRIGSDPSQATPEAGKRFFDQAVEDVARELGLDPARIIKLASNENPHGPSPRAVHAAERALEQGQLYPDGGCYALRQRLAAEYGLGADQFVIGNGSNEILELLGHVFLGPGDEAVMGDPAFVVYKLMATLFGAETIEVPDPGFVHDLDAMLLQFGLVALPERGVGALFRAGGEHHALRRGRVEHEIGEGEQDQREGRERPRGDREVAGRDEGVADEVADAVRWTANGPLPDELIAKLTRAGLQSADPLP